MYCIYTDKDVPPESGNWDHVIPLSLGGQNQFQVWSDRCVNSKLGSHVDGKLSQDPLLRFALRDAGVTGHGGKKAVPVWKKVDMNGRPIQMTWGLNKVTAWDARERRELSESELVAEQMTATLRVDRHVAIRFLAKVALGGGYFLYGNDFRSGTGCSALRDLALLDMAAARKSTALPNSGISICDRFHSDSMGSGPGTLYRALLERTNRSLFIAIPHDDAISFHVGLVGIYVGSITCPADTSALPTDGDHDLGHVLGLAPGEFAGSSFRSLCEEYMNVFGDADWAAVGNDVQPGPGK